MHHGLGLKLMHYKHCAEHSRESSPKCLHQPESLRAHCLKPESGTSRSHKMRSSQLAHARACPPLKSIKPGAKLCLPPPYLHDIDAGVKVDGSFGFLAVLFVLVGVEDVRAIGELRQIEVPPFEDLQYKAVDDRSVVADRRGVQHLMTASKNHNGQNGETFPFAALAANVARGGRKCCHVLDRFATSPRLRFYGSGMTRRAPG